MADDERLLDELGRKPLDYSRRRFLWTWLAVGVLAIMTGIALISAGRTAETNLEQTDDIARVADQTADAAQASTDQVVSFLRGEQGIPGVPGANGEDGTPGQPGTGASEPGRQGAKGDQGEPGSQGPPGTTGGSGPAGSMGQPGSIGLTGTVGEAGPKGEDGAAGPRGEPGSNGKEGAAGPAGPQGAQGAQGPPGVTPPLTTSIAVGQSANDTTTPKTAQASCASGRATGGGYALVPSDPGLIVTASSPVGNTGWNATAEQLSLPPGTSWQLLVFAVCIT